MIGRRAESADTTILARTRAWLAFAPPMLPRPTLTLIIGLSSFALFAALAGAIQHGAVPGLDSIAMPELGHGGHSAAIRHLFRIVGGPGGAAGTFLIIVAVVIGLLATRRSGSAIFFGLAVACSASSPLLKDAFDRRGPPNVQWVPGKTGFFPSGHAVGSMAVAASVVTLAWRTRFRMPAVATATVFVIAVGLSAVLTGDHWTSDVVGGWALSVGWVSCVAAATATWAARHDSH